MPTESDDLFVPLAPVKTPARERTDYRVTVLTQPERAQAFRPLGQAGGSPASPHPTHEPRVDVQREGERVTSIQIQCTCGQFIELACDYNSLPQPESVSVPIPAPAAPPPPTPELAAAEPTTVVTQPPAPASESAPAPTAASISKPVAVPERRSKKAKGKGR